MSVVAEINKVSYVASGATTYPIPFYFTEKTHIKLYVDDVPKVITTHYSVTGEKNPAGGTLTIIGAPLNGGESIIITREVPITQGETFTENGPFLAKTLEGMFDKLTFVQQQLKEILSRSIRFPISSAKDPQITGDITGGGVLLIKEDGTGLEAGPKLSDFVGYLDGSVLDAQAARDAALAAQSASENAQAATEQLKIDTQDLKADVQQLKTDTIAEVTQLKVETTAEKDAAIVAKDAAEAAAQAAEEAAAGAVGEVADIVADHEVRVTTLEFNILSAESDIDTLQAALAALDIGYSAYANEVVNNGGVVTINSKKMQIRKVSGSAGAVVLANQALGAGAIVDNIIIVLIGTSDANPVGLVYSDTSKGILLNGDCELKAGQILHLMGDTTMDRYLEISRNF